MKRNVDFNLTCCFTGHRSISATEKAKLKADLEKAVLKAIDQGATRFISGGALGFDMLASQVVLEVRKKYPVILEIAVPCADQACRWSERQKREYQKILDEADKVTVLFEKYVTGCMHFRDAFMVDNSDMLIAYYRGHPGGTQYTFMYAERRGLKIINI